MNQHVEKLFTVASEQARALWRQVIGNTMQCPCCKVWMRAATPRTEVCCPQCSTEFEAP